MRGRSTTALAEPAPLGTLVNYPAQLRRPAGSRPGRHWSARAFGTSRGDPELDSLDRGGEPPRAYVALGSFLSARSDVLGAIAGGLRQVGFGAVIASGVTPPDELGPLPEEWIVLLRMPQVAALRACDVVVCHGGTDWSWRP